MRHHFLLGHRVTTRLQVEDPSTTIEAHPRPHTTTTTVVAVAIRTAAVEEVDPEVPTTRAAVDRHTTDMLPESATTAAEEISATADHRTTGTVDTTTALTIADRPRRRVGGLVVVVATTAVEAGMTAVAGAVGVADVDGVASATAAVVVAPVAVLNSSNLPICKGCRRDLPFVAENATSGVGLKSSVLTLALANYLLSYFAILRLLERLAPVFFQLLPNRPGLWSSRAGWVHALEAMLEVQVSPNIMIWS